MALVLGSKLIDAGLGYVTSNADRIYICSAQPTTYAEATSTFALGYKDFGVGGVAGSPVAGTGGRKISTNPVTAGIITAVGNVAYWAIVDTVNSLLLATGDLSGGVPSVMGQAWTLGAIAPVMTSALLTFTFDPATESWVSAVATAGGTVSPERKLIIDAFIAGLKLDGVWWKFDRLWMFAVENSQGALIDLVALDQASAVNAPALIPDKGYTGDGTTSYINTTYNAYSQGVNYEVLSAHVSFWDNTNRGFFTGVSTGVWDGTNVTDFMPYHNVWSPAGFGFRINTGAYSVSVANGSSIGFFIGQREGANQQAFYNGTLIGQGAVSVQVLVNIPFFVGGRADGGSGTGSLTTGLADQFAMVSYGAKLTWADAANFYSRLCTYFASIATKKWADAVALAGGTISTARRALVSDLVFGLMLDGVWPKLDRLWLFAAENYQTALIDLVAQDQASAVNTPTFTPDRGYAGSSTAYIDTTYNPVTNGVNYTLTSAHIAVWDNTNRAPALVNATGSYDGVNVVSICTYQNTYSSTGVLWHMHVGGGNYDASPNVSSQGFFIADRSSFSAQSSIYNGALLGTNPSRNAIAIPNLSFFVCGRNDSGVLTSQWTTDQFSMVSYGGSLLAGADAANYYSRLQTYMRAVNLLSTPSYTATTEANAWEAAVVTAGGSVSTGRKTLVIDLIVGLKTDGIWPKLDRLWLYSAENLQSALTDLVTQSSTVMVGPNTFMADKGIQVFQRAGYFLDFNYIPSSNGVNFTQDSAHFAYWDLNNSTINDPRIYGTSGSGTGSTQIISRYGDGQMYAALNSGAGGFLIVPVVDGRGFLSTNRSSSSDLRSYRDGNQIGLLPTSSSGTVNTGTTYCTFGSLAAASIGGSLTATEQKNFYKRLLTYMQAVWGVVNPEMISWLYQVYWNGGTVSPGRMALVDALIGGLKQDGLWDKLDRLWLFAAENTAQAFVDIRSTNGCTVTNSPVFTVDRGYQKTSNTSSYIDLNFSMNYTPPINHSQNSACVFAWSNTSGMDGGPLIGLVSSIATRLFPQFTDGNAYYNMNNIGTSGGEAGLGDGTGLWLANRSNSTSTQLYRNGSLVSITTATSDGTPQGILALNENANLYSSRQISCAGIGSSMSAADNVKLSNRLRTHMTAIGVP